MANTRTVTVGGQEITLRASALIPRLYRFKFGRDVMRDMARLQKSFEVVSALPDDATEDEILNAQLSALDLEVFENIAWLMARLANKDIPEDPDEWLDGIDGVFSIYDVLPTMLELWRENQRTTSTPKKK